MIPVEKSSGEASSSSRPRIPVVERSWVLVGQAGPQGLQVRAHRLSRGQPHQVEADWRWALAREESHGDVAGFLHTHPPGSSTHPSPRDHRTMQAWCSAFGKPLFCLIRTRRSLSAYLFTPGAPDPRPVTVQRLAPYEFLILVTQPSPGDP